MTDTEFLIPNSHTVLSTNIHQSINLSDADLTGANLPGG
ncbi:MAG: hypothetical protein J07HQW2_00860 [Haloquadratum walsbyi J07HQW2]|uniref:Pentapeptide repeat-containing protein n=1 Tax=Haloquadratum walsbyi J07HQW2 TaxID=1238425 RepID=U1PQ40_9EURY|nr:MAG: hypothetical protein J07HQW2_00860 [Haloquadratum walsbyi J07HQW2]